MGAEKGSQQEKEKRRGIISILEGELTSLPFLTTQLFFPAADMLFLPQYLFKLIPFYFYAKLTAISLEINEYSVFFLGKWRYQISVCCAEKYVKSITFRSGFEVPEGKKKEEVWASITFFFFFKGQKTVAYLVCFGMSGGINAQRILDS